MERIINMIIRQVMRRVINKGIDAGLNKMSGTGAPGKPQDAQALKSQRQAAKTMRRMGRM